MGMQPQPKWNRRKSHSGLKKFLLVVVIILGVYAGWGIWQDYQDVGHFDLGRSIGVAKDRWVGLPGNAARMSSSAIQNLNSSSTDNGPQKSESAPQEQASEPSVSAVNEKADSGLLSTGMRRLSGQGQGNDPFFAESPSQQNSEATSFDATAPNVVPDGSTPGVNPRPQQKPNGSSTTPTTIDGISVWDTSTNRNVSLNAAEYNEFQSTQVIPDSALARNQGNTGAEGVDILPSSATSGLDRYIGHMLDLINKAREERGLTPVKLGTNPAAQQHSVSMLQHNFVGHWGIKGLTPEMRYTLAGGSGYLAENVSNLKQVPYVSYPSAHPLEALLQTHTDFMESPAHRENILNPWHTHVNLGIACDHVTCAVTQDFERDFIDFTDLPSISDGVLTFSGHLRDKLAFAAVEIWYHEPPHSMTFGQLDATFSYYPGQEPATFLLNPPSPGHFYSTEELQPTSFTWGSATDPYKVEPDSPRVYKQSSIPDEIDSNSKLVPLTIARLWETEDSFLKVEANISEAIQELGPGVYTVYTWGSEGTNKVRLTNYSIFVD